MTLTQEKNHELKEVEKVVKSLVIPNQMESSWKFLIEILKK